MPDTVIEAFRALKKSEQGMFPRQSEIGTVYSYKGTEESVGGGVIVRVRIIHNEEINR